jgi:hypothetical protein
VSYDVEALRQAADDRPPRWRQLAWLWARASTLAGVGLLVTIGVWKAVPVSQVQAASLGFLAVSFVALSDLDLAGGD